MAKKDEKVWTARRISYLVVLAAGTIALVAITILPGFMSKQQAQDQADQQAKALQQLKDSNKPLKGYEAKPFDKDSVKELKVTVLKQGKGKKATTKSTVTANYFGWTSDGQIFDSSNKNGTVTPASFPLNGVIKGWTKGLTGVRAGSTVKLMIPSDLAYGTAGSSPLIGPNEPLAFIVELKAVK